MGYPSTEQPPANAGDLPVAAAALLSHKLRIGPLHLRGNPAPVFAALAKTQAVMEPPARTEEGYSHKYAPFDAYLDAVLPTLTENGCLISQIANMKGQGRKRRIRIWTWLIHESGTGMMGSRMDFPLMPLPRKKTKKAEDKNWKPKGAEDEPEAEEAPAETIPVDPTSIPLEMWDMASAITYAKRYSLGTFIALHARGEDDDGAAATGRRRPDPEPPAKKRPSTWGTAPEHTKAAVEVPTVFKVAGGRFVVRTPREGYKKGDEVAATYPNGSRRPVRLLSLAGTDPNGHDWSYSLLNSEEVKPEAAPPAGNGPRFNPADAVNRLRAGG